MKISDSCVNILNVPKNKKIIYFHGKRMKLQFRAILKPHTYTQKVTHSKNCNKRELWVFRFLKVHFTHIHTFFFKPIRKKKWKKENLEPFSSIMEVMK
jgi:UDP-2,3-diacylglucosamine pyrophosphatase LpxH